MKPKTTNQPNQKGLGLALVALSVLKDKSAGRYYIKSRKQMLKKRFETFLTVCVFFIKRSRRPLLFTDSGRIRFGI